MIEFAIEINSLSHKYDSISILEEISLKIEKGSITAVFGPSGCGKTTLLKIIAGLLLPTSGQVILGHISPEETRKHGKVGYTFQSPILLPWRTVLENIILPIEIIDNKNIISKKSYAMQLLKKVKLENEENKYPPQLSGGMAQRVNLARALITNPVYLLLDEPFGALDEPTRLNISCEVRKICKDLNLTTVFVTHNIKEAILMCDRVIILSSKPTKILCDLSIDLTFEREYISTLLPEFKNYEDQISNIIGGN